MNTTTHIADFFTAFQSGARPIPSDRSSALDARVDLDVLLWGEAERSASRAQHGSRSRGLLLNSLAAYAEIHGYDFAVLRAAASSVLTADDRAWLRHGG